MEHVKIICDETNNTQELRDKRILVVDIYPLTQEAHDMLIDSGAVLTK